MFCATPIKNGTAVFTKILIGFLGRDEASFVKTNHCLPVLFFLHFFTIWFIFVQSIFLLLNQMYGLQSGENKDGFKWKWVAGFGVKEGVMDDFHPISIAHLFSF